MTVVGVVTNEAATKVDSLLDAFVKDGHYRVSPKKMDRNTGPDRRDFPQMFTLRLDLEKVPPNQYVRKLARRKHRRRRGRRRWRRDAGIRRSRLRGATDMSTARERNLVVALVCLLLIGGGYCWAACLPQPLACKKDQLASLEKELLDKQLPSPRRTPTARRCRREAGESAPMSICRSASTRSS
jgi:hypothetical protein